MNRVLGCSGVLLLLLLVLFCGSVKAVDQHESSLMMASSFLRGLVLDDYTMRRLSLVHPKTSDDDSVSSTTAKDSDSTGTTATASSSTESKQSSGGSLASKTSSTSGSSDSASTTSSNTGSLAASTGGGSLSSKTSSTTSTTSSQAASPSHSATAGSSENSPASSSSSSSTVVSASKTAQTNSTSTSTAKASTTASSTTNATSASNSTGTTTPTEPTDPGEPPFERPLPTVYEYGDDDNPNTHGYEINRPLNPVVDDILQFLDDDSYQNNTKSLFPKEKEEPAMWPVIVAVIFVAAAMVLCAATAYKNYRKRKNYQAIPTSMNV